MIGLLVWLWLTIGVVVAVSHRAPAAAHRCQRVSL